MEKDPEKWKPNFLHHSSASSACVASSFFTVHQIAALCSALCVASSFITHQPPLRCFFLVVRCRSVSFSLQFNCFNFNGISESTCFSLLLSLSLNHSLYTFFNSLWLSSSSVTAPSLSPSNYFSFNLAANLTIRLINHSLLFKMNGFVFVIF